MLFLLALASLSSVPPTNSFCAGLSWVTLRPGETMKEERGPDFSVFRVSGPGTIYWGVYSGMAGQAKPDEKHLFMRDGVVVSPSHEKGSFHGYFAVNSKGWQNHFFGSVFKDTAVDKSFFNRVDFSAFGQARCRKSYERN